MSKQQRIIYGYDTLNHEKYHCSVDNFIDNYKQFAKDSFFLVFHSKEDRDSFALDFYTAPGSGTPIITEKNYFVMVIIILFRMTHQQRKMLRIIWIT